MTTRTIAAALFCAAATLFASAAHAFTVNIDDGCGVPVSGSQNTMTVDANGNVTLPGFAASTWVAGLGSCDPPLASPWPPRCTLTASNTMVEPNVPVTFHARCRTPSGAPLTGNFTWTGPVGYATFPGDHATRAHLPVTFTATGTYTVTMQAHNAYGWGPPAPPVTVVVGAANDPPSCTAMFSPNVITQNQASRFIVSCQPAGANMEWEAAPAGAPAPSGWMPVLTFPAPGIYTYKMRVQNAAGVWGPKVAATINVISDGSCVPGPYVSEYVMPVGYSQESVIYPNQANVYSFSVASGGIVQMSPYYHTAYTTYTFPNAGQLAISKCRGDFNVPAQCTGLLSVYWTGQFPATNSPYATASTCNLEPGVQYFVNIKPTDCSNSPYGLCGFRMYRAQ